MKTSLYYFSGTGNCLKVAQDLAGKLENAEVISIPKTLKANQTTTNSEKIGIIYPVYIWGMPLIVVDFINKLVVENGAYIFAIATYGGMSGASLLQTAKQLKAKGLELSAGFGITMPGNYTPMYGAIPQEKQDEMFSREKGKICHIAQIVKEGKNYPIETSTALVNLLFSGIIYKLGSSKIPGMDKSFWVNEKCTHCGICQKVCPVGNITMENGKPQWHHKCEQCMACLQWCPEEAIQYGKKTLGRKRYRHPEVKVEDFMY